jgi:FMN phosphatase YigB (HAD superfamily)
MIIFFDIDETLIDQRRAERAAAERFLEVYGAELGDRSVERFCARWRALLSRAAPATRALDF